MDFEKLNGWFGLLTGVITGLGGFYIWLNVSKYNIKKDISEAKRNTKVSNVEGDEAVLEQLDKLLSRIATISSAMLDLQIELSDVKTKEVAYKSVINSLIKLCLKISDNVKECELEVEKIISELDHPHDIKIKKTEDEK